jgi:hypothetical protein
LKEQQISEQSEITYRIMKNEQAAEELQQRNDQLQHLTQQLLQRVNDLEHRLECVADCGVALYSIRMTNKNNLALAKLNATELTVPAIGTAANLEKIKNFYRLVKLEIQNQAIQSSSFQAANLSSNTLEHLVLYNCNSPFTSLEGMERIPQLKKLVLLGCNRLQSFVDILKSYSHKIENIHVSRCPEVNLPELATYCTQNNIRLTSS